MYRAKKASVDVSVYSESFMMFARNMCKGYYLNEMFTRCGFYVKANPCCSLILGKGNATASLMLQISILR